MAQDYAALKADLTTKMLSTFDHAKKEFAGLRTGRAAQRPAGSRATIGVRGGGGGRDAASAGRHAEGHGLILHRPSAGIGDPDDDRVGQQRSHGPGLPAPLDDGYVSRHGVVGQHDLVAAAGGRERATGDGESRGRKSKESHYGLVSHVERARRLAGASERYYGRTDGVRVTSRPTGRSGRRRGPRFAPGSRLPARPNSRGTGSRASA